MFDPARDAGEAPLVKLTTLILRTAVRRSAEQIRVRLATAEHCVVELTVGERTFVDTEMPAQLLGPVVRRLSIMARLPTYPKGSSAEGEIHLRADDARDVYFRIRVSGHGESLTAELQRKW